MLELVGIVLPVFALIAVGSVAARTGLLSAEMGDALGRYAFVLALPALLFRTLSAHPLPSEVPFGYWLAYFGALAVTWIVGQGMARHLFKAPPREAVLAGLSVAQANTVMVGIPIVLRAYGEAGAVPIAMLIGLNLPITLTIATILFEASGQQGVRGTARALGRGLATHPILLALVSGLAGSAVGFRLPPLVDAPLASLAATAVPCALVALGTSLVRYGLGGHLRLVSAIAVLKLLFMPACVLLAGRLLGLAPIYVGAGVIFASAPVGVNVYILAARYRVGLDVVSGAIALTTIASVATTTFWLWVLGIS